MEPDTDITKDELQQDVRQIKQAMGLYEQYPWFTRMWLVEGIGLASLFPLLHVLVFYDFNDLGISPQGAALFLFAFFAALAIFFWIGKRWAFLEDRNQSPWESTPNWDIWHLPVFAGVVALVFGLVPILDDTAEIATFPFVYFSLLGVGYIFMGQLLDAYHIRKADQYAFSIGGVWLLALVAVIPYVPVLPEWSLAGLGVQHVASYIYLSRTEYGVR